jgi:gas vesicle protein
MNRIFLTLLAGVAIGLLIAPAKGSDTWRRIVDGFDEYKDRVTDETNDILQTGKDAVRKGKSKLEEKSKDWADRAMS